MRERNIECETGNKEIRQAIVNRTKPHTVFSCAIVTEYKNHSGYTEVYTGCHHVSC
jgi:hypothetical protein